MPLSNPLTVSRRMLPPGGRCEAPPRRLHEAWLLALAGDDDCCGGHMLQRGVNTVRSNPVHSENTHTRCLAARAYLRRNIPA